MPNVQHRDRERVALYLWRWEADELRRRARKADVAVAEYVRRLLNSEAPMVPPVPVRP